MNKQTERSAAGAGAIVRRTLRPIRKVRVTLKSHVPGPSAVAENDPHCFGVHETSLDATQAVKPQDIPSFLNTKADSIAAESCFGLGERANPALLRAIEDCAHFNGRGFFQNRRENRIAMLVLAYLLLLELLRGGEEAIKVAISKFPPDARVRRPSMTKPELIAVQLTAKPENEPQRKLCSDYGSLLLVARVKGLSPTDFVGWVEEADIGDCKVKAKRIRAALKAGAPTEIDEDTPCTASVAEIEPPWVQISHGRGAEVGGSCSTSINETTLSPVADVIEAGIVNGNLSTVLRRVADMLELAERTEGRADGDVPPL
ncbi:hypothetical protein [Methylobacterium sp. R2-1]|uniref:hypothetical protein n=1 Tax=Methylobacterium sp. R2-1 TaxID=2587064 RepID=UPI001620C335|nr:hypothetical protein [Methylobacterium sp. R2-1]MBB2962527.1 hypothetical protein [Methylobacterium sp. R2-1]